MQNIKTICFIFSILTFAACKNVNTDSETNSTNEISQLGDIDFKVTGAAEAQPYFEKGLLLLHSFEYEDARAEFLNAQEKDSTFAMAYWGEAMTHNHSLWQRQEKEDALEALQKLAPDADSRMALVHTELEKDFFGAVEILFGEGTKYDRDIAYKKYMEALTQKYPDNHEVAAFYAISLLGSARNGRDEELYNKSAKIAQGIMKENPDHPGALHYLIHSFDDPEHAHLARAAADSYSKVAPDAAHALHMPSHIYVALGKWDEVVTSNIASWNASVKRMERKDLGIEKRSYHAYNWLQYGLLQRGEVEKATTLLEEMKQFAGAEAEKIPRSYLIAMKGAHMVETNTWEGDVANIEIEMEGMHIMKRTGYALLEGMKAYHQKDIKSLSKIVEDVNKDRKQGMLRVGDKGFSMCSAGGFESKAPNQLEIDMVKVMEMELKAYLASLKGNKKEAKDLFEKAVLLDEGLSYSFGPPRMLKPIQEAYAEWLLEEGNGKDALVYFEKSLERFPRRLLSLQGKKKAAELLNNKNILTEVIKEIEISLAQKERKPIL